LEFSLEKQDGADHRLKVKVDRGGLKLQARLLCGEASEKQRLKLLAAARAR
jgi:hypothetical protein